MEYASRGAKVKAKGQRISKEQASLIKRRGNIAATYVSSTGFEQ